MQEHSLEPIEDLRERWTTLSKSERLEEFQSLPRELAGEFFLELSARDQADLILALPPRARRFWMRLLAPDDAADLIQEAPEEEGPYLLEYLDETTRREVIALLAYKDDEAGGLMSPRFARVRPEMTVDEAISYLRRQSGHVETIYYAYALDPEQRLLGVVSFRDLFAAERDKAVRDIMWTDLISVPEEMDQEAVANLFREHHLLAIPVVDHAGRMKGIVTVDDIVDVVEEEASEDIHKIGGMEALDTPYLEAGFFYMIRKRGGWLAVLFLGEMLTATAMAHFEHEIASAVVLALFIPLIISSGGNSGSQAATLVVRALAVGELRLRDWWRVVQREVGTGLTLGALLGGLGLARVLAWQAATNAYGEHGMLVGVTVALSLLGVVLLGTLSGALLPMLLSRIGVDPATASAPFVATLVDVTGLVIYFSVASIVLSGTLL
jgi:magnesium transporter